LTGFRAARGGARVACLAACILAWPNLQDGSKSETRPAATEGEEIVLGMSTALTGPASDLGVRMLDGVRAALDEVGRNGGIRGRKVRVIALDDGYEPERTGPNVRRLIDDYHVVALVGDVGTPTAVAALPIASATGTPFFGAVTGAGLLRKSPPDHNVVNYRASYAEETRAMIDGLVDKVGLPCTEIAFFTQRDAYGDAGFSGGLVALKAHGLQSEKTVLHARYERNTLAVETAVAEMLLTEPRPRAVVMIGTYAPCAAFIKLARSNGLDALFLNVSFVGSHSLLRELGEAGEGVIITQVVPHFDDDLPIVAEYRAALGAHDAGKALGFASLEGYISTRILCRALARIDGRPDRESVIGALEGLGTFDIGLGEPLRLSSDEHQACHRVWPTIVRGGNIVPLDWSTLKRSP
jgi:branched-chain amino acid transport system substrate-binding protein